VLCKHEVVGSIPSGSTILCSAGEGDLAIIQHSFRRSLARAAGWIDIVKEAGDPALYPSAFRIALTTTKSSNNLFYVRTRESYAWRLAWHVLHRTWVCMSYQASKGRSGNALAVRGDERRGTLR
jgi:hypothetical protein